jgi:Ca2+-binding EF-hand superfamily protein
MAKRGMKKFINFTDDELNKLRQYFQDLDEDGSGKLIFSIIDREHRCEGARKTSDLSRALQHKGRSTEDHGSGR